MRTVTVTFLGCTTCGLLGHCAQGAYARHPSGRVAIATCFHGPVHQASFCACGQGRIVADGQPASVLEQIEARDVAWVDNSILPTHVLDLASTPASAGDGVTVGLPTGVTGATIIAVTGREHAADVQSEVALDRMFQPGESGSPVLDARGTLLAVVRNICGRCGFVAPQP